MEVVTQLRTARINDIPAMLRQMADDIEAGRVVAETALFIVPQSDDWPMIFGWGEHPGAYGNIAICEMAKAWFVQDLVTRVP